MHADEFSSSGLNLELVAEYNERLAEHLPNVQRRIERAGGRPNNITIVAVTKGFGPEAVVAGWNSGLRLFGENYADELVGKAEALAVAQRAGQCANLIDLRWTFQGRLQTNKINRLLPHVSLWQSIDSSDRATALAKRAPQSEVLIQVNVTEAPQRSGCSIADVPELVSEAQQAGLIVKGFMCVGPDPDDAAISNAAHNDLPGNDPASSGAEAASRAAFSRITMLREQFGFSVTSMGMSDDLEAAVACGATMVRLGSALFGARPETHP
jgi:PLP dependent protein